MDDDKERKRKLLEEMMSEEGIKTLSTSYESEEHERASSASPSQQSTSSTCPECNGKGRCTMCKGTGVEKCPTCKGSGRVPPGFKKTIRRSYGEVSDVYKAGPFGGRCPDCLGDGIHIEGVLLEQVKCSYCNGNKVCPRCGGTGKI